MSLLGKKWVVKNQDENADLIEKLLKNRTIDTEEKKNIFFGGHFKDLLSPYGLKDMHEAVDRIKKAIQASEKILIFGDYDVDGISATAQLFDFFKMIGADIHYRLPNRENEGYGLKKSFIDTFKMQGVGLIITVDCGTSNYDEIAYAKELGIDVIVTDHHSMPEKLPPAVAVINPKRTDCTYANKEISGSGMAFKLLMALAPEFLPEEAQEPYLRKQVCIAALGIVSDCMSMLSQENRILVKEGLNGFMAGLHPGISALLNEAGYKKDVISSMTIGFQIGPRLNAAGRLDVPDHALELLLGNLDKATILNQLNKQRQGILEEYMKGVMDYLESQKPVPNIIILVSKEWRNGLLGLIASKVVDHYHRPTIVMQDKGDECVASMRSVNDFDITGLLRKECDGLFKNFGGHTMAGGFTLPKSNLAEFLKRVEQAGKTHINPEEFVPVLNIDCTVSPRELTLQNCTRLQSMEPFGQNNPEPTLMLKNIQLADIRPVGSGEHLQLPIKIDQKIFSAIAFRFGKHLAKIDQDRTYDIAFKLEINEWNNTKKVQLNILDIKPSQE